MHPITVERDANMNSITGFEPNLINTDKSFSVTLDDARNITFTTKDPYGFLEASIDNGVLPDIFTGRFTSPREARNAVTKYNSVAKETSVPVIHKKK